MTVPRAPLPTHARVAAQTPRSERDGEMFDAETIDRLFDIGEQTGNAVQFCLFDKRVLLPVDMLASAVKKETGEEVDVDELRRLAGQGWFPLLEAPDGSGPGAPLYAPSRIGLYMKLHRDGFSVDELRLSAACEEYLIDEVYTTDEFAYCDDDLETLILHAEARVEAFSVGGLRDANGPIDQSDELAKGRRHLEFLRRLQQSNGPLPIAVRKAAYRVRASNDTVRVMLLNEHRDELESGYGPNVCWSQKRWSGSDGRVEISGIRWPETIRTALAHHEGNDAPPIRVPGFVLRGDNVLSTRTLTPTEYQSEWERHDLDAYLLAWAEARGERRCLRCLAALPDGADPRKRFCSEKCRNAEKQRRFRERNPEAADRARRRYWESVDVDGEQ